MTGDWGEERPAGISGVGSGLPVPGALERSSPRRQQPFSVINFSIEK